ncbi:hypothetical protein Pmar_PMAR005202 [Perkinsus marinus ATCC 50983]|uniref:Uncharacterized protein n=1 Tax=Perkinsus marinus (strain ATCC 50983 / TXsc) TaxID=423536 RepID=C5KAX0_PERM5|nr:hypothetical protein Pmar_PMAR005202 [Perkinsus marinus ATCC 50983]EER18296.1 hypothetical protein Pmar_PMAR005202 [Perkinsus marinus ATCC 50983]|eukprot:XP_002786500.1 hypothetical protein Pmar_PMAR005202 [Perkinsus marinus ATCC 50983]
MRINYLTFSLFSLMHSVSQCDSDASVNAAPVTGDAEQRFLSVAKNNEVRISKSEPFAAETTEDIWGDIRLLASDDGQGTFGKWSNPVIIISSVVAAVALFFLVCCCGCGYIGGLGSLAILLALGGWILYIKLYKN